MNSAMNEEERPVDKATLPIPKVGDRLKTLNPASRERRPRAPSLDRGAGGLRAGVWYRRHDEYRSQGRVRKQTPLASPCVRRSARAGCRSP
jgi:hypothetical protein